jgi:hypothetical protein
MKATAVEYRFRFILHAVIIGLGFWAPWCEALGWTRQSTWLVLSSVLFRAGWLSFGAATNAVLIAAIVLVALGAWMRVWGASYVGASVVQSGAMHGETMLADGPYRRTRNVLIWVLQIRLALAEEPFLTAKFGEPYVEYRKAVPRFLPAPTSQVPAAGKRAKWLQGIVGEIYMVGVVITFVVFGWGFNATTMERGVLISLGAWLIVKALLPRASEAQPTAGA